MAAVVHDRAGHEPAWPRPGRGDATPSRRESRPPPAVQRQKRERPVFAMIVVLALMVTGSSIVDAVVGMSGGPAPAGTSPAADRSAAGVSVRVVQSGDTYWSVAEALDRPGDIRARVDALQAANDGRVLRAGDRLVVPVPD